MTCELNGRKVVVTGGKLELDRTIAEAVADVVILDTGVEGQPERIETAAPKD